jgi:hypothetical protein
MRFLPLFLLAVSLLLSACAVESEKPLSSPRYADRDPRLEGLWRVKLDEKDIVYFYIAYGPGADGSIMLFGKDKTGMSTMSWDFFVTRTPKHAYLNMIPLIEVNHGHVRSRPSKMNTFAEYRFSWSGQLVVSSVGGEVFSKAVKEGKLHGKTDPFTTTISHERSERVLAFIETSRPEDVFMKSWTATKIGSP